MVINFGVSLIFLNGEYNTQRKDPTWPSMIVTEVLLRVLCVTREGKPRSRHIAR